MENETDIFVWIK